MSASRELTTTNPKIVTFYESHPSIPFDEANLLLVNLLEKAFNSFTNDSESTINSKILSFITNSTKSFDNINNRFSELTNVIETKDSENKVKLEDMESQLAHQMESFKSGFIREMTDVFRNNLLCHVSQIVETNIGQLLNQIYDFFPRTIDASHSHTRSTIESQCSKIESHLLNFSVDLGTNNSNLNVVGTNLSGLISLIKQDIIDCVQVNGNSTTCERLREEMEKLSTNISTEIAKEYSAKLESVTRASNESFTSIMNSLLCNNSGNSRNSELIRKEMNLLKEDMIRKITEIEHSTSTGTTNVTNLSGSFNAFKTDVEKITRIIKTNEEKINSISESFETYLGRYKISSEKGKMGENCMSRQLNNLFQQADIEDTSKKYESGDFIVRQNFEHPVLVETKDRGTNVSQKEVDKFIRDANSQNMHGIFFSHTSGIVNKKNFDYEISKNQKFLLYITNCEYSPELIKTAFDMVYFYSDVNDRLHSDKSDHPQITEKLLLEIDTEINTFTKRRNDLSGYIGKLKQSHLDMKTIISALENDIKLLTLPSVDNFLTQIKKKEYTHMSSVDMNKNQHDMNTNLPTSLLTVNTNNKRRKRSYSDDVVSPCDSSDSDN